MNEIEEIYKNYANLVYKYILCISNNPTLSEEITQETFLIATEKINTFEGKCKISTWLCQIAKFLYYKKIRKNKKYQFISIETLENNIIENTSIVEEKIIDNEEKLELLKQIQKLNPETANIMYLRILGNLEYSEIAQITGKTSSWCRTIFFRGKEKIKEVKNEKRM